MRLAGQCSGGFFAAPPEAIAAVLARIDKAGSGPWHILDPCAGEGVALAQITSTLGTERWAIELDEGRAEQVALRAPKGHWLAPCDFLRSHVSPKSMSMVWCNPPFDYQGGDEGRVEWAFVERALPILAVGGLLALVCPESVGMDWRTRRWFRSNFEDRTVLEFPESCRRYNEVVLLGTRRKEPEDTYNGDGWDGLLEADRRYWLPSTKGPAVFTKTEPTDKELAALLQQSPLRGPQVHSDELRLPQPPLPPSKGHLALLLASGHLNGLVTPEGEPPHVLRGTALKEDYLASVQTEEEGRGKSTTRTVYSQRIKLLLRVLTADGEIVDLL